MAPDPHPEPRPRRAEVVAGVVLVAITLACFRAEAARALGVAAAGLVVERVAHPRGRRTVRRRGWTVDATYLALQPVLTSAAVLVIVLVGALSLAWVPGLLVRPLVTAQPSVLLAVELLVLADLAGYWVHRAAHEMPTLWRFHAVHHSSAHLDALAAFRLHPLDGVIIGVPLAFLVGAGFGAADSVGALVALQVVTGSWAHLDVRWRLRPLQPLVLTPAFHHWHHADEPAGHHTNYGQVLPVWDLLFGTYRVPDRYPPRYGTSDPVPASFTDQLRHPFAAPPSPTKTWRRRGPSPRRWRTWTRLRSSSPIRHAQPCASETCS